MLITGWCDGRILWMLAFWYCVLDSTLDSYRGYIMPFIRRWFFLVYIPNIKLIINGAQCGVLYSLGFSNESVEDSQIRVQISVLICWIEMTSVSKIHYQLHSTCSALSPTLKLILEASVLLPFLLAAFSTICTLYQDLAFCCLSRKLGFASDWNPEASGNMGFSG